MNTRTYHRNSVMAFPRTVEYGAAIERPAPAFAGSRAASVAIGIVIACLAAPAIFAALLDWI